MADGGRVVLVTGAAGAIGSALLRRFGESGARVAGTDLGGEPPVGVDTDLWVPGDVTVASDVEQVVARTLEWFGRIDVVVVNAGVTALGTFEQTSDEAFRRVMDVNLHGALHTTRAALPALREAGGRLVVLSSVAGFAPVVGRPAYAASKHAITGLFESIRDELEGDGVSLTLVFPTFLATSPADVNTADGGGASRSVTGGLLTAHEVAHEVVRACEQDLDRVYPGLLSKAARALYRLSPRLYVEVMRRRLEE